MRDHLDVHVALERECLYLYVTGLTLAQIKENLASRGHAVTLEKIRSSILRMTSARA
jgi:hypothetical protein